MSSQSLPRLLGQKRSNSKFWVVWYMFLGQISVKEAKNDARNLLERPKSDKIWKYGNCRNPRKLRKKWISGHSKRQNSAVFSRYQLKYLYKHSSTNVLSHLFLFLKIQKMTKWKNKNVCGLLSLNFKMFKNFKIRDSNLIVMFNLHHMMKTNRFYL